MTTALYPARAHVAGGGTGRGPTPEGRLELDLRPPKELGGDGARTNPEELFAIGYAACFGTTLAMCPYSTATRDNIDVALVVNGTRL
ncbi:MAG: hypothetical protein ACJ72N_01910 [Labedaea sp.]